MSQLELKIGDSVKVSAPSESFWVTVLTTEDRYARPNDTKKFLGKVDSKLKETSYPDGTPVMYGDEIWLNYDEIVEVYTEKVV